MPRDEKTKDTEEKVEEAVEETPKKPRVKAVVEEVADEAPEAEEKPEPEPEEKVEEPKEEPEEEKEEEEESSDAEAVEDKEEEEAEEEEKPKKGGNFKVIFVTALITAIVVGLLAGGVYVYTSGTSLSGISMLDSSKEEDKEEAEATPEATPEPTATPEPADLTTYKVQVLNGTGKAGVASAGKSVLTDGGFEVAETGNADSFDFTETVIEAKKDVPESVIDKLNDTLSEEYTVKIGDTLSASADFDVVVTIGSK